METRDNQFATALEGLRKGDFTRLALLFKSDPGTGKSWVVTWYESGLFAAHPAEAAEALTCACFLGEEQTAAYLLSQGLHPAGGCASGMDAVHYAASRGQLATLRLLLDHGADLETRNMYGGTALGQAIWSAVNQPRPGQLEAIRELLLAGADVRQVGIPTGHAQVDGLLQQFGGAR